MSSKRLLTSIQKQTRRTVLPGTVIDVLGNRCTVRLSGSGRLLTGIPYSGPTPLVGDDVTVDYKSLSNPVATTFTPSEFVSQTTKSRPTAASPIGSGSTGGGSSVHNSLLGLDGGNPADGEYYHLSKDQYDALMALIGVSESASVSRSPSQSISASESPSYSPSASMSKSPSRSVSASNSPSYSFSRSPSASESTSESASESTSESSSPSSSISPSSSLSPSASESASPSTSISPSASESESPSMSISPSTSLSASPSSSTSPSSSISPSASMSSSPSTSPSQSGALSGSFWVGGSGNWNDGTNHWASSSGGTPNASNTPTSSKNAIVDNNSGFGSGGTIALNVDGECLDFISDTTHTFEVDDADNLKSLTCYGSFQGSSGMTLHCNMLLFMGDGTGETVDPDGCTFEITGLFFAFMGGGEYTLLSNLVGTSLILWLSGGTFKASSYNITVASIYGENAAIIYMGSGTWTLSDYGNTWTTDNTCTIYCQTSTLKFTNIYEDRQVTFAFNPGVEFYNIWYAGKGTFNLYYYFTCNEFKVTNAANTIVFQQTATFTISTLNINGTSGNLVTIKSFSNGHQHILQVANNADLDYLYIRDSNKTGAGTVHAGSNSTDVDNNDGWLFP